MELPKNVIVTSDMDHHLDCEDGVNEAKRLFKQMYPNEEFLPKAPDPDELVYVRFEMFELVNNFFFVCLGTIFFKSKPEFE